MMFHRHTIGKILPPVALTTLLLVLVGTISVRLSAAHADTGSFALSANPTSATVAQGDGTDYSITIVPSGYLGTVNVNIASCPPGATCTFDGEASKSVNVSDTTSVIMRIATSATGTPIGSFSNITVIGTDSVNQSLFASTVMSLTVTQGKGFSLNTGSKRKATVSENGTGTISIIMDPFEEFAEDVVITWGIRPANSGITFVPASGEVTLTSDETSAGITVNAGTQTAGTYTLDFTGTSTSGIVHTAAGFTLTVTSSSCTGATCDDGQTCTASGCKIDPSPSSNDCNADACYTFDANSVQKLKDPAPDGCWASWPACQNVSVLKVRKDRQCNQWLGCRASIAGTVTQGDGTSKLTEPQCTQLGVCAQLGPDGRCLQYINPGATKENISFETPGDVTGSNSLIRWFSGYSSGFRYSGDTIVANYPAADISETGLSGATTPDLVVNGTFEELRCLGGTRDRESCVVPSDCRVGSGVCVDQSELNGPVNVSSSFPCTSNKDCKNQKVNDTPVPNCRYLASWGGDALCRNPFDAKWLGVLPPASGREEVGYGYTPGEASYEADIQSGIRRKSPDDIAVKWRVWEDDANFADQSGNIGTDGDPRFPSYSPFKHTKEGNNFLKVEVQPNAPLYSGVGIPLGQALTVGAQYTLSFKYKINTASGQTLVPIKAQIGLNYTRGQTGNASFHGYEKNTVEDFVFFGVDPDNNAHGIVGGAEGEVGSQSVCAVDPSVTCSKNSECGGSLCVDTGKWQEFTMTSKPVVGIVQGKVSVLEFVTATTNGSSAFTYFIDDVSLKPVLNIGTVDSPRSSPPADSELFKLPRRCRLFPQISSPDCQYTTKDGTMFNGWRGYCLDKDPRNADLCLTWWPLDLLAGEGGLGGIPQGYTGPAPLFQCVEQGVGPYYIDVSDSTNVGDRNYVRNGTTIPSEMQIRLRDIERMDLLFDADDETGGEHDWSDVTNPTVRGSASWKRDGSRYVFLVDPSQFNRVADDNGFRVTLHLFGGDEVDSKKWAKVEDACGGDRQWMTALFHFSGADPEATIDWVEWKICDERDNNMENTQRWRFIARARQSCNYIVQTVDNSQGTVQEKSWTNRVKPLSGYLVPNVQIPYTSDLAPYGSIAPPVAGTTPNGWGNWTPDGTFDAGIQVLDSASGSPRAGTPYSLEETPKFGQDKYCFNAAVPNEPVNNPGTNEAQSEKDLTASIGNWCSTSSSVSSCVATSDDSQCIGRPAKRCSANPQQPCSTDVDCRGFGQCVGVRNSKDDDTREIIGAAKGIDNLKHIFAKSFGCWSLNAKLSGPDGKSGKVVLNYESGCPRLPNGGIWDVATDADWSQCGGSTNTRSGDTKCFVTPTITNISVNAVTSGVVSVSPNDQVTIKFNYAVDAEQLPGRYIKVIWDNTDTCTSDRGWLTAPTSPVVATTDFSSMGSGTYHPQVCVKDNWEKVGTATFGGNLVVTD